jgi:hypothetical protein
MPSRATIEAATCPAGPGHHLKALRAERLCARPMRWSAKDEFWICEKHGLVEPGEWLVLAQLGVPVSA